MNLESHELLRLFTGGEGQVCRQRGFLEISTKLELVVFEQTNMFLTTQMSF